MNNFYYTFAVPKPDISYGISVGIGVGLMLLVCIFLGLFSRKKASSFETFLSGHQDIGPVITGLALGATWLSGWAALGMMGITYTVGWSGMWFAGIWTIVGIMPCLFFTGAKMQQYAEKFGARTVSDVLGIRFDSKVVQSLSALVMIFFMILYAVGQFKAGATVWYAVTGLSAIWCLSFSGIIVFIYMIVGGYTGTQWSLALQGALLGIACFVLGIVALVFVGGPSALNAKLALQDPKLIELMRTDLPVTGNTQLFSSPVGIVATFFIFLTMATGFPHNVARFLGMRKLTKRDFSLITLMVFLVAGPPIFLNAITGLASRAAFGPALLDIAPWRGDLAAPYVAMIAGGRPITILYVVGVFAAALSTLSSMVMVMAGNITRDIIHIWKPNISRVFLLNLTKVFIGIFLLIPFYWTFKNPPELLAVFMGYASIGLGGIFIFCTAVSFFWRRATAMGAILCMIYGVVATLVGSIYVANQRIGMGTLEFIVLIGCAVFYFVGSLLTRPVSEEKLKQLFGEKNV
ncbi:MAG: sodium:solute symporter family protein [Candidatus Ratteibacteria bacterium]